MKGSSRSSSARHKRVRVVKTAGKRASVPRRVIRNAVAHAAKKSA